VVLSISTHLLIQVELLVLEEFSNFILRTSSVVGSSARVSEDPTTGSSGTALDNPAHLISTAEVFQIFEVSLFTRSFQ
jgi:hypothetical protein